jgi:transposase
MSHPATPVSRFIGCDVGKTAIVVFDAAAGRADTIANEPQALSDFAASLEATCFVVCEATGGYEGALLAALLAAGVPAHRADARKVKAFIRSFGTLGKTDAIDAKALARYGKDRCVELACWQAKDRQRPHRPDARARLASPPPGCSPGLAPHPKQSGQAEGYRRTRGGRPEVKRVLFMAALAARKHNPSLKAFFEHLVQAGKKPLVAITAIMRKLVVIANAKLKTPYALQLS